VREQQVGAGGPRTVWPVVLVVGMVMALLVVEARPVSGSDVLSIGGDERVNVDDFRVTVFASGLDYPYGMIELADGSILVATSKSDDSSLFASTGELLRFVDADGDGVADGPGEVLATDLAGVLTGLAAAGNLVYVASSGGDSNRITVLRLGSGAGDQLSVVGSIDLAFPDGWGHRTYGLAVRPVDGGEVELYFNVGSQGNIAKSEGTIAATGLVTADLVGESIYRVNVEDDPGGVSLNSLTLIATGVRNAAALAIHPETGDLYFADNGINMVGDENEALSADELNVIVAGDLGGVVEDFGFTDNYVEYRTGTVVGGQGVAPLVAFQPLGPEAFEAEGPAGMSFAPSGFPDGLNNGVFVGFYGNDAFGPANEENPLVYVDPVSGEYFHFVATVAPGVGHLSGLLATQDSLFVTDLASTGSMFTGAGSGIIYQIKSLKGPDPSPGVTPTTVSPGESKPAAPVVSDPVGYRLLEADGTVYACGDATGGACSRGDSGGVGYFGDAYDPGGALAAGVTAIAMDVTPSGNGYAILLSDGSVVSRGDAPSFVSARAPIEAGRLSVGERVASISVTSAGQGYWLFTNLGRVLAFGMASAGDLPSMGIVPNGDVISSVATTTDSYYMLGADGGVFAFGDALFLGSVPQVLPGAELECAVVGLVPTLGGAGYWMVGCDGGVFAFGDAPFVGSLPEMGLGALSGPITGMVAFGGGYVMVGTDGGVFTFGAPFFGSLGATPTDTPITAIV